MPPGTSDFYGAAAQVIPVLVLVVIVEQQRDESRRLEPIANFLYALVTIGAAALGEMVALRALYRGHAHLQDQYFVIFALVVCALAVLTPVVVSTYRAVETDGRRMTTFVASTAAFVVVWFVLAIFLVLIRQQG